MEGLHLSEGRQQERLLVVRVRLSDDREMPAVLDHLAGLARAPLKLGGVRAGRGDLLKVMWLSDGHKASKDWKNLLMLVMAAMLASLPSAAAAVENAPLAAPLHRLVRRAASCCVGCSQCRAVARRRFPPPRILRPWLAARACAPRLLEGGARGQACGRRVAWACLRDMARPDAWDIGGRAEAGRAALERGGGGGFG